MDQHFPEISKRVGEREINLERLRSTIQAYWDMIPKKFLMLYIKVYLAK
jgi:hypothetical protein